MVTFKTYVVTKVRGASKQFIGDYDELDEMYTSKLQNLEPSTKYYYQIKASEESSRGKITTSSEKKCFTTLPGVCAIFVVFEHAYFVLLPIIQNLGLRMW